MEEHKPPTVIEQTAKRYKAIQLRGLLLVLCTIILSGIAVLWAWFVGPNWWLAALTLIFGIAGVCTYAIGRALAWWHHG